LMKNFAEYCCDVEFISSHEYNLKENDAIFKFYKCIDLSRPQEIVIKGTKTLCQQRN
ncbi:13365_t:CDS:1, partial [Funneliformis caledonium]